MLPTKSVFGNAESTAYLVRRRAEDIDPFSLIAMEEVGWPLFYARRFDDAMAQFGKVIELAPNWHMGYYGFGNGLFAAGGLSESDCGVRKSRVIVRSQRPVFRIARSLLWTNRSQTRCFEHFGATYVAADGEHVSAYFIAIIYLGLGERNHAMESLEKACADSEFNWLNSVHLAPMLDPLRSEPRFKQMVRWLHLKQ